MLSVNVKSFQLQIGFITFHWIDRIAFHLGVIALDQDVIATPIYAGVIFQPSFNFIEDVHIYFDVSFSHFSTYWFQTGYNTNIRSIES